jgi:hypothetical protein
MRTSTDAHPARHPPVTPPDPTAAGARAAFADALRTHHFTDPTVRAALGAFVARAREAGAPPERVVIDVKEVIRPFEAAAGFPFDGQPTLREELVWWAITLYYLAD